MLTENPHECFHQAMDRFWPQEFTKPRLFDRRNENRPYIEYIKELQAIFDSANADEGEDGEEDDSDGRDEPIEDADEDEIEKGCGISEDQAQNKTDLKDVTACAKDDIVRLFMKGVEGEEDALHYLDQVEHVASFCAQQGFKDSQEHVAMLYDSNNGIEVRGGSLTARQLRDELSKERHRVVSHQKTPKNRSRDVCSQSGQRVIFITNLDSSTIEAIAATAPINHAPALRDLFYKHLAGKSSIGVNIPSIGFHTFNFEFHLSYYVLKEGQTAAQDSRKKIDGNPLRQSWDDLPFLSMPTNVSKYTDAGYCLYDAQTSVAVTGIDHWVWTAYGFVDTYFGSKDSVDGYDQLEGPMGRVDPLAAGQILVDRYAWTPREYFFKVFEIRINEIRRQWNAIIDKVEGDINHSREKNSEFPLLSNDMETRQKVRDFSSWSSKMGKLLTKFISRLSDTIHAWDQFRKNEIGHFLYDEEHPTNSPQLKASVAAVDKAYSDLNGFLSKLQKLEKDLCKDNPQGLNAYLSFQNHESAIFQQRTARHMKILTVITILFFPLGLAANIFSTAEGVLPFKPNPARFTYALLILSALVGMTLVVSLNWTAWFQSLLDCMEFLRKAAVYYNERAVGEAILDQCASSRVLEGGNVFQETAVPQNKRGGAGKEIREECTAKRVPKWRLSHRKATKAYIRKEWDIDIEAGMHGRRHGLPNAVSFPPVSASTCPPRRSSSVFLRNASNTSDLQLPSLAGLSGPIAPQLKSYDSASSISSTARLCFHAELDNREPWTPYITGYTTNPTKKFLHLYDNSKAYPALLISTSISEALDLPGKQFNFPEIYEDLPRPIRYETELKGLQAKVCRGSATAQHGLKRSRSDAKSNLTPNFLLQECQKFLTCLQRNIEIVRDAGFCSSTATFFQIDPKRTKIAFLRSVELDKIVRLGGHIDEAKTSLDNLGVLDRACKGLLGDYLGPSTPSTTGYFAMNSLRVLDLVLVSHVCSHMGEFDRWMSRNPSPNQKFQISSKASSIIRSSVPSQIGTMNFSRRKLKCLNGFTCGKQVWVLHGPNVDSKDSTELFLSTTPKALADVWGPLWEITSPGKPEEILRYDLDHGSVVPMSFIPGSRENSVQVEPNEALCHWICQTELAGLEKAFASIPQPRITQPQLLIGDCLRGVASSSGDCHINLPDADNKVVGSAYRRIVVSSPVRWMTRSKTAETAAS